MRIYLCGQKMFGARVFHALIAAGHTVVGVSSPPFGSRTCSDGTTPTLDRLRQVAGLMHTPWLPAGELRAPLIERLEVDLIVAAHSHDFIGRPTREAATLGALGYHPSLLPRHRGRDAVRWALHMGDAITGGTVYWLDQNVDGGPIALQEHVHIRPDETVETLWREKLAPLGVRLLVQAIAEIGRDGFVTRIPQDEACATWEPAWDRPPLFRPELPRLGDIPFATRSTR